MLFVRYYFLRIPSKFSKVTNFFWINTDYQVEVGRPPIFWMVLRITQVSLGAESWCQNCSHVKNKVNWIWDSRVPFDDGLSGPTGQWKLNVMSEMRVTKRLIGRSTRVLAWFLRIFLMWDRFFLWIDVRFLQGHRSGMVQKAPFTYVILEFISLFSF